VSRRHAKIDVSDAEISVADLGSANGILVNGNKCESSPLTPGDEIRVGRYTLVLLEDGEKFYKGHYISYMAEHGQVAPPVGMKSTAALDASEIDRLEDQRRLINKGRIALGAGSDQYWLPEDRKLTFGRGGMVAVGGLFTAGIVAEVAWNGNFHVARKLSGVVGLKVNGVKVAEQSLQDGDRLKIGRTSFVYQVP
jgi:pSer/pThr/pTyr-binding forkhead associated (FHA) protein